MLNKNVLIGLVSLLFLGSCSSTKSPANLEQSEAVLKESIKITNVTVQEMVAGVQGAPNTFQFLMNIDLGTDKVEVDSVYYDNMKAKVFPKNVEASLYVANATALKNPSPLKVTDKKMVVLTFKHASKKLIIKADSFKVLETMYLP